MADIHTACQSGDLSLVRALVDEKPESVDDDDKHNWRPLFHAALHKRLEIVRLLLEQGADVSAHKGYVLHYAAEVPDNQEIVTLLIQYGALDAHVRPANDLSRQFLTAIFLNDVRVCEVFFDCIRNWPFSSMGSATNQFIMRLEMVRQRLLASFCRLVPP